MGLKRLELGFKSFFGRPSPGVYSAFPLNFPNIIDVSLVYLPESSTEEIFQFLCALPRLEILHVGKVSSWPPLSDDSAEIPNIQRLHISDSLRSLSLLPDLLSWSLNLVAYLPSTPELSALELSVGSDPNSHQTLHVNALLRANRRTLRHLTLIGDTKGMYISLLSSKSAVLTSPG